MTVAAACRVAGSAARIVGSWQVPWLASCRGVMQPLRCWTEGGSVRSEGIRMLDDAELLLGVSRHLSTYMISPAHAALESLQYAGQVYELAWRLRNAPLSSAARIEAIAQEAAIGPRQLLREVLPTL